MEIESISTQSSTQSSPNEAQRDFEIARRTAEEFAEQSFEQVGDAAAKLVVHQKINETAQKQYDNAREHMLSQYNQLRDVNNAIYNRTNELINSFKTLSPDRKLEKALYNKSNKSRIENEIYNLENKVITTGQAIKNAESYLKSIKDPLKQSECRSKIQYNKDNMQLMKERIKNNKEILNDLSDYNINKLKLERNDKMIALMHDIDKTIANDKQLIELIKQRDNIEYMINTDNRKNNLMTYNVDPNGTREALANVATLIEQHVNKLSEEGELD